MNWLRTLPALIAAGFLLGACGPRSTISTSEIPLDHTSAGLVKTIGIVTPRIPEGPTVFLDNTVGKTIGSMGLVGALIGGLADASLQEDRETHFKAALAEQNFSVQDSLLSQLGERLKGEGYSVARLSEARPKQAYLTQYPADPPVDAYLDIIVWRYGYLAAGIGASTPYRPLFTASMRLVRAKDSQILMQDWVSYSLSNSKGVVTIAPDPNYGFADFDTLMANKKKALDGLSGAIQQSADAMASLLK